MTARTPAGTWRTPFTNSVEPPSVAELHGQLARDFPDWEVTFRGDGIWRALHPSCGLLTSSSAIGLRDAIETAERPRPLTGTKTCESLELTSKQGQDDLRHPY